MPTVLRHGPYRFFFVSQDVGEPRHIHVARDDRLAKFWIEPIALAYSRRFGAHEIRALRRIVEVHADHFRRRWDEFFD